MTLFALYPSRQHVPANTRCFLEYLLDQFGVSG